MRGTSDVASMWQLQQHLFYMLNQSQIATSLVKIHNLRWKALFKKKKKIHERPSASPDVKWLEQDFKHRPMQHFMTENNSNQDFTSFRNPSSIHKQVNTSKKGFFQKIIELCPLWPDEKMTIHPSIHKYIDTSLNKIKRKICKEAKRTSKTWNPVISKSV